MHSDLFLVTHINAVHGFPVVSYNVSEGNTLDTTFGLNMKGRTRFPSLLLAGYVTAEADTAGKCHFNCTVSILQPCMLEGKGRVY